MVNSNHVEATHVCPSEARSGVHLGSTSVSVRPSKEFSGTDSPWSAAKMGLEGWCSTRRGRWREVLLGLGTQLQERSLVECASVSHERNAGRITWEFCYNFF